jgi:site-specific DNA recombinase
MADTPRKAGIYTRLSYAPDGSEEKVDRQEADCRQLANRLAWPISEDYVASDNNRSAWQRNRKRPGWDRLLAAIESGEIDALIVYHGDRLIRQPYDLEKLITVADAKGVRIASVSGTRNLDNPDDRYILRIEAAGACRASDDTSRRVKRGLDAMRSKGIPRAGGRRPFGYARNLIDQEPAEAEQLREAVERLLAGQSIYGVVAWLNEVSTTTTGGEWKPKTLKNLLRSPRIMGMAEFEGTLIPGAWEPIVDRATWEDIQHLLDELAAANPYQGQERRYLLSGWAQCAAGHPPGTKPSGGRNRKTARLYHCRAKGCPQWVARNVEHLDAYVEGRVLQALHDPELMEGLIASDRPDVAGKIAELERRKRRAREQLENLADQDEDVDAGLVALSLASFDRKIEALRTQGAASARQRLLAKMAGISRQAWDATPLDVRAATVQALFRVTVLPATWRGPGFRAESVRLEPV